MEPIPISLQPSLLILNQIWSFDCKLKKGLTLNVSKQVSKSYSRVHISSDEVFSKILKKPSIVQK